MDPLKILLPQIGKKLEDKGILIISGIIDDRYDEIMPYIKANWHIIEERIAGPWHNICAGKTMKKIFILTPLDESIVLPKV